VREELVPEPHALVGAFEQARDIRDRELAPVLCIDGPEHGRDRRERIVGHLGLRIRDPAEE